ncbi:hypothetical protein [Formosa algae]|uniref:hypothetical protein n=1 Tax=Formosa algae TaxID=225843 RepID=UPI000CCF9791|nr:hypothetical protein [Formosa algae]PNW29046.1 hypothetical protein BKP44_05500 [Formosa algae]
MKRTLLILLTSLTLIACNTAKQVEKAVYSGDYDYAIYTAIDKLQNNKEKKRKAEFIIMLEDAFTKGEARDLSKITYLKMDANPENYQEIFDLYNTLSSRQEAIKPILPLRVNGKDVTFNFKDYNQLTIESKKNLSGYIYTSSLKLLASKNKTDIRQAYDNLVYLNQISPNYKNTYQLINDAQIRGIDYILVTINNQTRQIIPNRLQNDLLNFDTYGLDKQWSVYHAQKAQNVNYDYAMQLNLRQINVSPERINQREIFRERKIVDGTTYKKDRKGNPVKDSLGNFIKEDKIININYRFIETVQSKEAQILANVVYTDLKTNQVIENFPIDSGFIFENRYAEYYRKNRYDQKDERALIKEDRELLRNRPIDFPSNEQMVFDTGEDLKLQLKDIINEFNTY